LSGGGWTPANIIKASSRITFNGDRAVLEFLDAASSDVELSLNGEITFTDPNDVVVKLNGATPIFDLTLEQMDCVNKIKMAPASLTLAPAVTEIAFRGSVFHGGWTVTLQEPTNTQSPTGSDPDTVTRQFPLCLSESAEEKTLLLGGPPRPEAAGEPVQTKREGR
jgi:hypothetical protein